MCAEVFHFVCCEVAPDALAHPPGGDGSPFEEGARLEWASLDEALSPAHQRLDLLLRLRIEDRRAGDRHEHERDVLLLGRADGEPAEVAELRQRHVGVDLEAELLV